MVALFFLFLDLIASPFKSKSRLEAENAALRHQLIVLQRIRPESIVRWHRAGFGALGGCIGRVRPWIACAALDVARKRTKPPLLIRRRRPLSVSPFFDGLARTPFDGLLVGRS
jgi:hypothetical protein